MEKIQSRTTPSKIGPIQWMIEGALLSKYKLGPHFWKKGGAPADVLTINSRLYKCFVAASKRYGEEVLLEVFKGFTHKQKLRIVEIAKYNQVGDIIATLSYYCEREKERLERVNKPKDVGDPEELIFDPGEDIRVDKGNEIKPSVWSFLNG